MTFFRYFFLTLASLLALPLAAQTPTDPVAWLKAEGNATDATSFANNGVVTGTVPYVTGKVGSAFSFTGNGSNSVRIPNSASLQSSLLTVEYWIYFNSVQNSVNVTKRSSSGAGDAWQVGISYSAGNFNLQFVGYTASGLFDWYSPALSSPVGVWTHVAASYDGTTVKGYINGAQVLSQVVGLQLNTRNSDIFIGAYPTGGFALDGKLDELSIYNRALSAAEVLAIFQAGSTGKTSPPTVTSLSPNTGGTAGGTSVTITGTNFTGATAVTFGGNAATNVTVVNSTTITATTPARTAGTASVIVTTPSGTNAANSLYTYVASAPTVTSISPSSGTTLGGTSVTITGTNFTGATAVTFGGNAATNVTVVNSTTITATTPAGTAGTASVIVATPGGTNAANSLYTYVAPAPTVTSISPNSGTTVGGASVTITGTNFTGATAVTFGGNAATNVTVVNSTTITATTPAGTAGTTSVIVATPGGTNGVNALFAYVAVNSAPSFFLPAPNGNASQAWTPTESARYWSSIASSADGTKLVAAAFHGQIYTSTDSGVTWTPRESNRSWISVASSADGSKLVAVVIGGQIYTSTDSGVTWTPRASDRYWFSVTSSADGSKLAAVVYTGQIYTSTDSGATWTARENDRYWRSIDSSADGTKLVAIVESGQIYTSTNSGSTWTARESNRIWWNVTSSADGSKLAAVVIGGQIYTSTDSGVSWTPRESNRNWNFITSSADGTRLAATVEGMQIFTSVNGGETWTARESNRTWTAITSSADGGKLAATVGGGYLGQIYLSPRDPYNVAVEIAPQTYSMAGFATSITPGLIGEESQTVTFDVSSDQPSLFTVPPAISSDGTLTFRLGTTPGVTTVTVIAHDSGGTALGGTDTSVPQTFTITALPAVVRVTGVSPGGGPVEGGTSVVITGTALNGATAVTFGGTAAASFTVVNHTTIHATTPAHLVGAVNVQVSAPAGTNAPNSLFTYIANTAPTFFLPYTQGDPSIPWTVRDTQRTYVAAAVSADGYKMAAVNYGGQIFTSTDSGITWVPRENNRLWRSIASSRDGTKLAAVAYGQKIYTSTDSGETWTPRESDRNWVAIASSGSGDYLAAAVENGQIYYSSDSGATWTPREVARSYTSLDYSENGRKLAVAAESDYLYVTHPFGYLAAISNDISQFLSIAVSSDSENIIAAEGGGYLYISNGSVLVPHLTDAYRSWRSVDVSGDGTKMGAVVYGERIYLSSDSGASWTPCESNRNWFFITTPTNGNGWVALADGRIYTSPRAAYTVTHPAHSSASVSGFVRNITAGPASESWQTVSFQVTNDNNALFTTQPAVSSDGTLTFVAGTATGSATVTVTARDNGGTLSGGVDTSVTQTFIITLTPALPNVSPSFALRDLPAAPSAPWTSVVGVPNPSVFALSADGRKILAATGSNGLFTSKDGGVTWTKHLDNFSSLSVTSSADGMRLAAASTGTGLWASIDGGDTWTYRPDNGTIYELDAADNGLKLIASTGNDLKTSPDGGITWITRTSGELWTGVTSSADGTKLAAVVRGGAIGTSSDGGATWTKRMTDANRQWWAITSSADGTKLAAVVKGGSIYTSSDSGVTWTARLTDANREWYDITSSADGTKLAAAVLPGYIYLSTDSGLTWTAQASELYWFAIACSADGGKLFATDAGYGVAYTNPRVPFTPSAAAASGPSTTPSMAQYISPGPATTESGQSVAFQVTNDNNALFLTQPAISGGGTLTFTPGYLAGTATVTVVAVDNGGTAYGGTDTSAPQTFTITVTPGTSPMDVWRQAQFGNATARIGDNDDFDFDGLANLLEYGLVLSPTAPSSQPAVQITTYPDGDRLRIILQRDPARSDVTIEVQASGDLTGTWTTLAASTLGAPFAGPGYVSGDDAGPGIKTVEVRDTVKVADAPRRFLRVKVNR